MVEKRHRFTIFMTACIAPKASRNVARKDPQLRLRDYEDALSYWMHYPDKRITGLVFTDNSGYDLSSLKKTVEDNPFHREVEFLQIEEPVFPDDFPHPRGYGYEEGDILDQSFQKSRLLVNSDYIIKTTGRLYFPNLSRLLSRMKPNVEFVIDSRVIPFHHPHYMTTTLFIVTYSFYMQYMYNLKQKLLEDNSCLEICYFKYLMPLYRNSRALMQPRFPVNVPPVGIGAHYNKNYTRGFWRITELLRGIFRIVLPFLWI